LPVKPSTLPSGVACRKKKSRTGKGYKGAKTKEKSSGPGKEGEGGKFYDLKETNQKENILRNVIGHEEGLFGAASRRGRGSQSG